MTTAYAGSAPTSGYWDSPMPYLIGESQDTDRGLQDVPNRYRQAVRKFWMYEGRSLQWIGAQLASPPLDYRTVESWLSRGHTLHQAALRRLSATYQATVQANNEAVSNAGRY